MRSNEIENTLGINAALHELAARAETKDPAALERRLTASQPDIPMAADMDRVADDMGNALAFRLDRAIPKGAIALVDVLDNSLNPLASHDPLFADDQGRFLAAGDIHERRCRAYIPFGVLQYPKPGTYQVRLRCVAYDAPSDEVQAVAFVRFQQPLPAPPTRPWSRVDFGRPLLRLGVAMMRADRNIGPQETRRLLSVMSDVLQTGPSDIPVLRKVMIQRSTKELGDLLDAVMARFGQVTHHWVMGFLCQLAWSDDVIDDRELTVIREAARHLNVERADWRVLARRYKLRG